MIKFANVNIERYSSDPVISLFWYMQIMFQYMEYDVTCIKEHGSLPHHIAQTLTARRICLGHSKSSILI